MRRCFFWLRCLELASLCVFEQSVCGRHCPWAPCKTAICKWSQRHESRTLVGTECAGTITAQIRTCRNHARRYIPSCLHCVNVFVQPGCFRHVSLSDFISCHQGHTCLAQSTTGSWFLGVLEPSLARDLVRDAPLVGTPWDVVSKRVRDIEPRLPRRYITWAMVVRPPRLRREQPRNRESDRCARDRHQLCTGTFGHRDRREKCPGLTNQNLKRARHDRSRTAASGTSCAWWVDQTAPADSRKLRCVDVHVDEDTGDVMNAVTLSDNIASVSDDQHRR